MIESPPRRVKHLILTCEAVFFHRMQMKKQTRILTLYQVAIGLLLALALIFVIYLII